MNYRSSRGDETLIDFSRGEIELESRYLDCYDSKMGLGGG